MDTFTQKIDFSGDCWEWTASVNSKGYGTFWIDGKCQLAHRVSYEKYRNEIPDGLQIDHLCRNKRCVKPSHLEPVTNEENNRRRWEAYTVCGNGHPMTPENIRVHRRKNGPTTNECRTCAVARVQANRDAKKAAKAEAA